MYSRDGSQLLILSPQLAFVKILEFGIPANSCLHSVVAVPFHVPFARHERVALPSGIKPVPLHT